VFLFVQQRNSISPNEREKYNRNVNRSPSAADVHQPDMKKIKREDKDGLVLEFSSFVFSANGKLLIPDRIHSFIPPLDAPEGTGSVYFCYFDSHCPLHRYLVPTPLLIPPAKGGAERNPFTGEHEKITILRWMSSSGSSSGERIHFHWPVPACFSFG
jgi:hypothetical protein